ncbi:MAG: TonB C-terminal domain-containing protein [Betaproteobacteria bacterium]|nr:TonB C-terminal domain-containing protein [Betaproteobacteria bacterium]
MHLLFFVLLVVGVSWQPKRIAAPVVVDLWSELPPTPQPKAEPPPPPPEPKPAPKPEPKPEPKLEPKPEPKPVPKPDIALKEKLEKERKRKELEAKQLEEQKKKEEAKKREEAKRLAEQKKREEEKKRLAEKEKQKKEEQARLEKEKEEQLRKLLDQQAAQAAANAKLDAYKRSVSEKIKRYVVLPPNIQGNPEAQFEVVQIPGGEILSVKLKRSSGNPAYDAAVERAIHTAQPLPPPPDPARFGDVRELELRFRPKE